MKFKPVKTAVIGCGMISNIYLRVLKEKFSIIELVGCSDIVESKAAAQAKKYDIRQMTNEEILSDPEIELVLNLTYASAHYEVNRAILLSGKHCYSEKMMCLTMEEADELDRIRREKGVMFAVAPDTFLGAGIQS
ncbi:MAG: Gfo/Idh/MocA family oxidoreductase, partial [Clostridia bacterium]|nr:Gfo/Idh/MocA family oxidoreductase [Clostridia bacterium]